MKGSKIAHSITKPCGLCITHLMPKYFEVDICKSSYAVYCSAENIDTLSTEGFLFLERKSLLQQVAHNEVSALVRLTFYENLLIGQETSVCFLHEWVSLLSRLNLEKIYRPFPWTNKTVRNNEVSIKADAHKVGCDCTLIFNCFFFYYYFICYSKVQQLQLLSQSIHAQTDYTPKHTCNSTVITQRCLLLYYNC